MGCSIEVDGVHQVVIALDRFGCRQVYPLVPSRTAHEYERFSVIYGCDYPYDILCVVLECIPVFLHSLRIAQVSILVFAAVFEGEAHRLVVEFIDEVWHTLVACGYGAEEFPCEFFVSDVRMPVHNDIHAVCYRSVNYLVEMFQCVIRLFPVTAVNAGVVAFGNVVRAYGGPDYLHTPVVLQRGYRLFVVESWPYVVPAIAKAPETNRLIPGIETGAFHVQGGQRGFS